MRAIIFLVHLYDNALIFYPNIFFVFFSIIAVVLGVFAVNISFYVLGYTTFILMRIKKSKTNKSAFSLHIIRKYENIDRKFNRLEKRARHMIYAVKKEIFIDS